LLTLKNIEYQDNENCADKVTKEEPVTVTIDSGKDLLNLNFNK